MFIIEKDLLMIRNKDVRFIKKRNKDVWK